MREDIRYVLENMFTGKPREIIYKAIGSAFLDKRALIDIKYADRISKFIDLPRAEEKITRDSFDRNFTIENIDHFTFKSFILQELSKTENFHFKYRNSPGLINASYELHYNDEYVGMFGLKKLIGVEKYDFLPYVLTEELLYRPNFAEGRKILKSVGINFTGAGGTVAGYVERNLVEFKPLFLDVKDYLLA